MGHRAAPPLRAAASCLNCGGDHDVRMCPSPKVCHRCRLTGHVSKECPFAVAAAAAGVAAALVPQVAATLMPEVRAAQKMFAAKLPPYQPIAAPSRAPPAECLNCGGAHDLKECPVPGKVCHRCHQVGHISKECPYDAPASHQPGHTSQDQEGCRNCGAPDHRLKDCHLPVVCRSCRRAGHTHHVCPETGVERSERPGAVSCPNCGGPHELKRCPVPGKICHKCRQVGHISKECPNQTPEPDERLPTLDTRRCMNCGGQHLLKDCPIRDKICHRCGLEGHISKECPYSDILSIPGVVCFNCKGEHSMKDCPVGEKICHLCQETGHISKDCPHRGRPGVVCFNCKGNHSMKDCPVGEKICHLCQTPGHVSKDCPHRGDVAIQPAENTTVTCLNCGGNHHHRMCPITDKICHKCGQLGHISKECPQKVPMAPMAVAAPLRAESCLNCGERHHVRDCPVPDKICHQCGGRGHISKQCPSKGQPRVVQTAAFAGLNRSRILPHGTR